MSNMQYLLVVIRNLRILLTNGWLLRWQPRVGVEGVPRCSPANRFQPLPPVGVVGAEGNRPPPHLWDPLGCP